MSGKLMLIVANEPDPEKEEEYNEWYNGMHIPMMFEYKGMKKASRYLRLGEDKEYSKYLALYKLETDSVEEFDGKVRERGMRTVKEGRFSDLPEFDPHNIPRVYKQIMPEKKAK
jgi:hypothetical protein